MEKWFSWSTILWVGCNRISENTVAKNNIVTISTKILRFHLLIRFNSNKSNWEARFWTSQLIAQAELTWIWGSKPHLSWIPSINYFLFMWKRTVEVLFDCPYLSRQRGLWRYFSIIIHFLALHIKVWLINIWWIKNVIKPVFFCF